MIRSPTKKQSERDRSQSGSRSDSRPRHARNTRQNSLLSDTDTPTPINNAKKIGTVSNMSSNTKTTGASSSSVLDHLNQLVHAPTSVSQPSQTPPPTNVVQSTAGLPPPQQLPAQQNVQRQTNQSTAAPQHLITQQPHPPNVATPNPNAQQPPQPNAAHQTAITNLQNQFAQMQSVLATLVTSQQQMSQLLQTVVAQQTPATPNVATNVATESQSNAQLTPPVTGIAITQAQPDTGTVTPPQPSTSHSIFQKMQLPRISKLLPEQSFRQLECYMNRNNVINDDDKFGMLQLAIEPETASHVTAIIDHPPVSNRYNTLKEAIIKLYAESQTLKMRKLLSQTQFRSTKPSLILSEMRQLHPGHGDGAMFKSLFLERLPPRIRNAVNSLKLLVPNTTELTLDAIAEYADQQMDDIDNESIQAVRSNQAGEAQRPLESMEAIVERVCKQFVSQRRGRSQSRTRDQRSHEQYKRSPSRDQASGTTQTESKAEASGPLPCFYHMKFGNNRHENRKCYPGCSLHKEWLARNSKN